MALGLQYRAVVFNDPSFLEYFGGNGLVPLLSSMKAASLFFRYPIIRLRCATLMVIVFCGLIEVLPRGFAQAVEEPSLFRGMQVTVSEGTVNHPVVGIDGKKYIVMADGKKKTLPADSNIQLQAVPRYSRQFVSIHEGEIDLTSKVYLELMQRRDQMQALQMTNRVVIDVDNETVQVEDFGADTNIMDLEQEMNEAIDNPDTVVTRLAVSSPWNYSDLYLLGLVYFLVEQDGEKKLGYKGQLLEVGALNVGESKVLDLEISGLPLGIEIDRITYHFYSQGRELATDLSEKRRVLNEDEDFEYLLLQYLASNEGKDRGPSLYRPVERKAFDVYLKAAELEAVILNVSIDRQGRASDVTVVSGLDHSQEVVSKLASGVRFFPSLKNGQPVEQTIKLRLLHMVK